jgi:UDP-2,3-diacylglucosamine pyrophosphatase LpxH
MAAKIKIIISDTHIGAGGIQRGNKLEDFISDDVFFQWVYGLIAESEQTGTEMTFIINGDWIECLQIPDDETFDPSRQYPTSAYTDVSPEASLRRLEIMHAGHPLVFQALADFLSSGPPRRNLVILYGNHDPELVYAQVKERLLMLLGARGDKRQLVSVGERSYFEDGVYVEHGNAYTEAINRFTDPDHPFDPDHPHLIERPPGSYVVTDYFNHIEPVRPWIDGVHPMSALAFYALAYDPAFALQFIKELLLALPDLGSDMLVTGADEESEALLTELKETDNQALARQLTEDKTFSAAFAEQVARALMVKGMVPPDETRDKGTAQGAAYPVPPEIRAREISEKYWAILADAADRVAREKEAQVVAFGHIHEEFEKQLPSGAIYLNTGTWVGKADFSKEPEAVWRDLIAHPEKYINRRQLTFARVEIDAQGTVTEARLFRANPPEDPPDPPGPMPEPGLWARFVMTLRKIVASVTDWL